MARIFSSVTDLSENWIEPVMAVDVKLKPLLSTFRSCAVERMALWCARFMGLMCAAGLMLAPSAAAYVLEGPHVLELMTRKKSPPQTLLVEQQVIIEDPSLSDQPIELEETLRYSFPDTFRADTQHELTHRILVVARSQALIVVDDRIISNQQGRFDHYKDVLLYRSRYLLHQALISQHVDVGRTSLGRWDDHIVVVIGAQYPDESVSQLWVDKELFLPLRWIIVAADTSEDQEASRLEFIYRDWRKINKVWYPMQIETTLNQKRIRLVRVKTVKKDVVLDAEIFNISNLMTLYEPTESEDPQPQTESELDEVERTIEDFRKKFEP
jgi:outer membrane lipoprotein-sorting protein